MSNLGSFVANLRRQKNWSQRKLALKTGVSNTEIARIERDDRVNVTLDVILKLAAAFNVSVVDMFIDTGLVDDALIGDYIKLAADESSLIAAYRRLDERGKNAVVDTARRELRYVTA